MYIMEFFLNYINNNPWSEIKCYIKVLCIDKARDRYDII
jgi:hypothetical protein